MLQVYAGSSKPDLNFSWIWAGEGKGVVISSPRILPALHKGCHSGNNLLVAFIVTHHGHGIIVNSLRIQRLTFATKQIRQKSLPIKNVEKLQLPWLAKDIRKTSNVALTLLVDELDKCDQIE